MHLRPKVAFGRMAIRSVEFTSAAGGASGDDANARAPLAAD
jgi:hypothetical protein